MRGSHHRCAEFPGLYVPIMRGSHHRCVCMYVHVYVHILEVRL
ncbi:unnamed protein product [Staurois parvus]|uniref:Uncharacterized protein n=1 Tax=Staurois parvus TaxID=386267 RepID=A0ABN9GIS5_9NEOB|nr:unnamed protein product [Staurois parvus]